MHRLLVANRGEIALRIIRTAEAEGIATIAIYTSSDALSPHVTLASESVPLAVSDASAQAQSESQAYLDGPQILSVCAEHGATMLHPGYGFLSENAEFAQAVLDAGIVWLGPRPAVIRTMGLKHLARGVAREAGVPCVPGSEGLVEDEAAALRVAANIGYPLMLKASAGGGGMGMAICDNKQALVDSFARVKQRAAALFHYGGVFLERYFPSARHIEVQIFGNGLGDIVCMGERECSIQRRHQKVVEEAPSPLLETRPGLRDKMCEAAIRLGRHVEYSSAGTVEFLVDNDTAEFFFLEMNTRIQVEHAVTEAIYPGLDLVKLMIHQAASGAAGLRRDSPEMQQTTYDALREKGRAQGAACSMEVRVYAENPAAQFRPCPGVLQRVDFPATTHRWLRVDTWISTGTTVTPFFDPLLAKIVVSAPTRGDVISRQRAVLEETHIHGPTNNLEYLKAILEDEVFRGGDATTAFLGTFEYRPCAMTILTAPVEMTVQDFPGRSTGMGIPRSGPMDSLAFRAANILVDNAAGTEGLEMIVIPGVPSTLRFHVAAVVAVTGKRVALRVDGLAAEMWQRICVPAGGQLALDSEARAGSGGTGLRTYLAIRGGFPSIPAYLGSKSTSMGLGGYQGRSLIAGDELALASTCGHTAADLARARRVPAPLVPAYPAHFIIHVLAGPHDDAEYVRPAGGARFYATRWRVGPASNRLGIRLESPAGAKLAWARAGGGAGGAHPSNILDNGYALGAVNMNGDTPVILTNEGPDMGGYACLCTVATAELWKVGQLGAGCTVEFRRVSWDAAMMLEERNANWLKHVQLGDESQLESTLDVVLPDTPQDPKLLDIPRTGSSARTVLRQAGDSSILVEFGEMEVDFHVRAKVHALETLLRQRNIRGISALCPCIRSTMVHFDPSVILQSDVVAAILDAHAATSGSTDQMTFPGRRLTFPIVLDDAWSREALERYASSIRDSAVYLPSNVDYLARNNGYGSAAEVLAKLVASDWLVLGVGFYLACPFLIPIDPRCRVVAQKMNPSRTYTPRGAVGIAGVVAAIYPIVSPGGYMLYGRTLPAWQEWGRGADFHPDRPWLLRPFDQVHFEPVTEAEYLQIESDFNAGRYAFKIEETTFSMAEYTAFTASIAEEIAEFEDRQRKAVEQEDVRERQLLREWELRKKIDLESSVPQESAPEGTMQITSPVFGNIWKILCRPGDAIESGDTKVAILEAMKTEVPVKTGEGGVGKKVVGFGPGIREGASVRPGDVLVVLK
ncbi:allophanate hydrolase subunit 2-domain-containing protein [Mycena pura]|uniref:Allophanate hydrolase subunit 2-domain-containing protein n=1 Tax=Mycena pura TaxID=153505 RepID=A0AAD6VC65_9AGAR|nr:allophanate hydrolase subunit 2-domain-containing protein [Mycena pura]